MKKKKKQIKEQNPMCQKFFLLARIIFVNNTLIFKCRLKKSDGDGDFKIKLSMNFCKKIVEFTNQKKMYLFEMLQDLFNIVPCGLYSDKVRKLKKLLKKRKKTKMHHRTPESS